MEIDKLCMGCMEESSGAVVCPRCGWRAGQEAESPLYLPPGTLLQDQFVVGRVLGHGGFGITYLAWDRNLERRVALKEYMPNGVATRTTGTLAVSSYTGQKPSYELGLQKFIEEARVLARFQSHPGMVAVQFFFQANGTAYLMMEYLDGITLEAYLKEKNGKILFSSAMDVLMPVMDALREVHKTGILHRDVSPDNIYITRMGPVKLLDFGAARYALGQHSQNFSIILKEGYAPEEQYRSKGHQGPWTDVYACAATLYRAITGKIPPPALDRVHQDEIELPSALGIEIPGEAEDALMQALAIEASARYQSMEDFQTAISGLRKGKDAVEVRNLTVTLRDTSSAGVDDAGRWNTARESGALPPLQQGQQLRKKVKGSHKALIGVGTFALASILLAALYHRHPASIQPAASQQASAATQTSPQPPSPQKQPATPDQKQGFGQRPGAERQAMQPVNRGALVQNAAQNSAQALSAPLPLSQQPSQQFRSQQAQGQQNPGTGFQPRQQASAQPAQPPTSTQPDYKTILTQAQAWLQQNNAANALQLEQRAVQLDPTKPAAYDMMGFTQLYYYSNYSAARSDMKKALQRGGFATFRVKHDRYDGAFTNTSTGILRIGASMVTYTSADGNDSFSINRSDIEQAAMNKAVASAFKHFFGAAEHAYGGQQGNAPFVNGAFHIKGLSRNYNLLGTSGDPAAEANLIVRLLSQ